MEKDVAIKLHVLDSLIAHSGKALSPDLIREICDEICKRMSDIFQLTIKSNDEKLSQE